MACSSPVVKYTKIIMIIIMDGGLSHIKCGKSNFIFVFSNNNIDKKMSVKGFHPLLWSRNQCVCLENK